MALKLEDKKAIVAEVNAIASKSLGAIAADYRGLTVAEITELRVKARQQDVYTKVCAQYFSPSCSEATEFACLQEALVGPVILLFSLKDPGAAARLVRDFSKDHEKFAVKALVLGGQLLAAKDLKVVADLPTREQALGTLLAVFMAPMTEFGAYISRTASNVCTYHRRSS